MYNLYILLSKEYKKTYTGITSNIDRRLSEHNNGNCFSTKPFMPWTLFHTEEYKTFQEARKREKYLKSCAGRKYIKKLINNIPK